MFQQKVTALSFTLLVVCLVILSCNDNSSSPGHKKIVITPDKMDAAASAGIRQVLKFALQHSGKIDDSTRLQLTAVVNKFYNDQEFKNIWSSKEKWQPLADSLFQFIQDAELCGLFPKDYNIRKLSTLKTMLDTDSVKRMDAVLWSKADVILTDACLHIIRDLKYGRLRQDSAALANDTTPPYFPAADFNSTKNFQPFFKYHRTSAQRLLGIEERDQAFCRQYGQAQLHLCSVSL
jgi:L,D-transpeptidase YcbB